ncbi:UDP:flavonoid glycosyltransferase YjiC (YdhE family) [Streptosporangium becharense]|nr:hypothetical protein [Streptosporangium becharense]MBB2915290.1 UDP:flavonoid glycosyltransferase YjiC (YdhE family) [Streptosporangium becharense]
MMGPFVADQPFRAARMYAAGVAPRPQPQRRLSAERLADAIGQATSDLSMARAAAALAERARAGNGAAQAVRILETL